MATTAYFVGRNCPHCGAVDSLQTDDVLGEVACTECALVVAMGLEEDVFTRYNENATYEDVDRHRERSGNPSTIAAGATALSSTEPSVLPIGSKVVLHPAMLNCIRGLHKKAVLPERVMDRAVELARGFVGGRRARGQRVERQQDVAAACLMIAAEEAKQPVPLSELRYIDSSLGDVELRRADIVRELRLDEMERRLRETFVENLVVKYILKLGLQVSLYQPHCKKLLAAINGVEALANMTVADRVAITLLLTQTVKTLSWEQGTDIVTSKQCPLGTETVYANFASKAHLDLAKVKKMMHVAINALPLITAAFRDVNGLSDGTRKTENDDETVTSGDIKRIKTEKM